MKGLMIISESTGQKEMRLMLEDILTQKIWTELDFWIESMITSQKRLR